MTNYFSLPWELDFLHYLQSIHTPFGDGFFAFVTHLGDKGLFLIGLSVLLLIFARTRRVGLSMAIGLVFSVLITNVILKNIVDRARPWMEDALLNGGVSTLEQGILSLISKLPHDASFPSGHSSASFACGMAFLVCSIHDRVVAGREGKKLTSYNVMVIGGVAMFILAGLIAFSRLYIGVHYPTDVIAGTVLGMIYGGLGFVIANLLWKKLAPRFTAWVIKKTQAIEAKQQKK